MPAGTADPIIGGIDNPALRTGIMFHLFIKPGRIADLLDSFQGIPEFQPVRTFGLKFLYFFTGILITFTTEFNSLLFGARGHFTDIPAIKTPLFRSAALAFQIFHFCLKTLDQSHKQLWIFLGPNIE
jgi:hypothetical protein